MSVITDDRSLPLTSIELLVNGTADPQVEGRLFGWYDVLAESCKYGTASYTGDLPNLAYEEGIGLLLRPQPILKNTSLAQWGTSGGSWEERIPIQGSSVKARLVQYDTLAADWSATLGFAAPANPSLAVTLAFRDTPPVFVGTTPFVRFEFGIIWAVGFTRQYGPALYKWANGVWQRAMDLPSGSAGAYEELGEMLVLIRCQRGRIGVSLDGGREWKWYAEADDSPAGSSIYVVSTAPRLSGSGGQVVFGYHQLTYPAVGTYVSPRRMIPGGRTGSPNLSPRSTLNGGAITLSSVGTSAYAQWQAILQPGTIAATPHTYYASPELYAVELEHPTTTAIRTQYSLTPWDGEIQEWSVSKPLELDGATARVRVRKDPDTQFTWDSGRWAKVLIKGGEVSEDGLSTRWKTVFAGHIRPISASADRYNEAAFEWEADNVSVRFKRACWTIFDRLPLGNQMLNAALDQILASEGLGADYREWHAIGDRFPLPAGSPEEPFEWPRPGESKWETMQRLAGYAGLELVPTDDGIFTTVPIGYVRPYLFGVWSPLPVSDLKTLVERVSLRMDSAEAATAVLVTGESAYGELLAAWGIDTAAERNSSLARYCPWREWVQETVPGTVTPGVLLARAQALADLHFRLKFEAEVQVPVNLDVLRRDQLQITDTKVGIADSDRWVVLTLEHNYRADPSFATLKTRAGLRRLT